MTKCLQIIITLIYSLFISPNAQACSPMRNWFASTNFDLVDVADAIVIAKPTKQSHFMGWNYENEITFKVIKTIKGNVPPIITSQGYRLAIFAKDSDPNNIEFGRPSAFSLRSSCPEQVFKRREKYILFLRKSKDGSFSVGISFFARDIENYSGPNSLWMKTIEYYLNVQHSNARHSQLQILKAKYDELFLSSKKKDQKLAADIEKHLSSISPYKPSQFLIESYNAFDKQQDPPFVFQQTDQNRATHYYNASTKKAFILRSLAAKGHAEPETKQFFKSLYERENSAVVFSARLAHLGQNGYYDEALSLARENLIPIVRAMDRDEVDDFNRFIGAMHRDDDNSLGVQSPRWKSHSD